MSQSFLDGYLACALWSSVDDDGHPLDERYDLEDIDLKSVTLMKSECAAFQEETAADLALAGNDAQNGHDFWLTRNDHGAGFWDRGYGDVGKRLTDAAHAWGDSALYIGDDGKLYIS